MTDDTAAIQTAINAAETAGGGIVFLPTGTYIVSSTLVVNSSYINIIGAGKRATFLRASSSMTNNAILEVIGSGPTTSHITFIRIQDLCIDGNSQGLHLKYVSLSEFNSIDFAGCLGGALKIEEVCDSEFHFLTIRGCGTNGGSAALTILNTTTDNSNNLRFYNPHMESNQGYDIEIDGTIGTSSNNNILFFNAKIEKGSGPGLRAVNIKGPVEDVYFDKCRFVNYYNGYGIYIDIPGGYIIIRDCSFWNAVAGGYAIEIVTGGRINIVDNLFYNYSRDVNRPSTITKDIYMYGNRRKSPDAKVNVSASLQKQFQYFSTSIPTDGTWTTGDIIWNVSPTAGGKIGWICVAGGTPGTWKAFGAIDA